MPEGVYQRYTQVTIIVIAADLFNGSTQYACDKDVVKGTGMCGKAHTHFLLTRATQNLLRRRAKDPFEGEDV
jgi:hypothetical protein